MIANATSPVAWDGYISKPSNSAELEQVIQSAVASSSPVAAVENVKSVTSMGIEEVQIPARLDGDVDLARVWSEVFMRECPKYLNDLCAAILDGNGKALEEATHALKLR